MIRSWSIPGADGQPIIGNTHVPASEGRGVIVIAHGFKGYKDYGMLPRIARECAARGNLIAHRFNFSHSGMTSNIATFERPDLFERDTWSKQVFDLTAVIGAIVSGKFDGSQRAGERLPLFLLGHSRGGVTALLTASRLTYLEMLPDVDAHTLAGVITLAAPALCNPFSSDEEEQLVRQGWLESPSSRTGQALRVGRAFLQEQRDAPDAHDLPRNIARIRCPMLVIHGENDPTVPAACAEHIARASGGRATLRIIAGGDHVFKTPNPLPDDQPSSPQLTQVIDEIMTFVAHVDRYGADTAT